MSLLQVSNLSFSYAGKQVLRDVGLALEPGEVVSLLGPNGSGKTTLLRALLGQLPSSGAITWEGRALSAWTCRTLARRVAYLPQTPTFDPAQTVQEALRLGRSAYWSAFGIESSHDMRVVDEMTALLDLSDLLHQPMDAISGGQRQRVFVGRCLVQQPAALLLDEPSTFLDLRYHVELCQLLRRLAKEKRIAVLMASHDLNLAAGFSDRLLFLHAGQIVSQGDPHTALQPELLSKVYGLGIECIRREGKSTVVVPRFD